MYMYKYVATFDQKGDIEYDASSREFHAFCTIKSLVKPVEGSVNFLYLSNIPKIFQ